MSAATNSKTRTLRPHRCLWCRHDDELTHHAFFGDGERDFLLTPEIIVELERKTGAGIGGLCRRLFAGDFKHADITETIRLGLIGGGTSPKEADALTAPTRSIDRSQKFFRSPSQSSKPCGSAQERRGRCNGLKSKRAITLTMLARSLALRGRSTLALIASATLSSSGAFNVAVADLPMLLAHDPEMPVGLWDEVDRNSKGLQVKGHLFIDDSKAPKRSRLDSRRLITGLALATTPSATHQTGANRVIQLWTFTKFLSFAIPCIPRARISSAKYANAAFAEAINRAARRSSTKD